MRQCLLCPLEFTPLKLIQNNWYHLTCLIMHNLGNISNILKKNKKNIQVLTKIGKFELVSKNIPFEVKETEKMNTPCIFCQSTYGIKIK